MSPAEIQRRAQNARTAIRGYETLARSSQDLETRALANDVLALLDEVDRHREALEAVLVETNFPQDEPVGRWVLAVSRIQNMARAAVGGDPE